MRRSACGRQLRPVRLRRGGRVMIKNEAPARFRALSVRDWVPLITDDHCYRPGHLDSQAGCQGNWPSGGEAVPTPRCRHTARRPTSMTRTQGRECSASSVGAILSHRSARVDPLQLGSHGARPAFSLRQLVRQGVPPGSLRIGVLAPRSRAPARPGRPRHQRAEKITLSSKPGSRSANSLASG